MASASARPRSTHNAQGATGGDWSAARQRGFTLIELLVVIAIVSILAALLLPALRMARKSALNIDCVARLSQLARASLMYANDFDQYPMLATNYQSIGFPHPADVLADYLPSAQDEAQIKNADGEIVQSYRRMLYLQCPIASQFGTSYYRITYHTALPTLVTTSDMYGINGTPALVGGRTGCNHSVYFHCIHSVTHRTLARNRFSQFASRLWLATDLAPGYPKQSPHGVMGFNAAFLDGHVETLDHHNDWWAAGMQNHAPMVRLLTY